MNTKFTSCKQMNDSKKHYLYIFNTFNLENKGKIEIIREQKLTTLLHSFDCSVSIYEDPVWCCHILTHVPSQ